MRINTDIDGCWGRSYRWMLGAELYMNAGGGAVDECCGRSYKAYNTWMDPRGGAIKPIIHGWVLGAEL